MSESALTLSGIVLNQVETGERHLRTTLFSSHDGLQSILLRKSRTTNSNGLPDLFDDVECSLQGRMQKGIPFVRELFIRAKRMHLSQDHRRFLSACSIAKFFLKNGDHLSEPDRYAKVLNSALDALMRDGDGKAVLFKTYFVFARDEGHPVKESWLSDLSSADRALARDILSREVLSSGSYSPRLDHVLSSLVGWLNAETELII